MNETDDIKATAAKLETILDGSSQWHELHYCLNEYCRALGVTPTDDDWALHHEARARIMLALAKLAHERNLAVDERASIF